MKISFIIFFLLAACIIKDSYETSKTPISKRQPGHQLITGADQMEKYLPVLQGKSIGFVINNNALIRGKLLSDTLRSLGINMAKRFGPERILRGSNGDILMDGQAQGGRESIPFTLLYGDKYKPAKKDLEGIAIMLFDVQDLGVRFYVYLSSLHYLMEACAENNIELVILDRPNPIGSYIDGPVLDQRLHSFLGVDPIPVVHGLTMGEYAQMINGERWLSGGVTCRLRIIPMKGYQRHRTYPLAHPPFPNLNSKRAVELYPSLCWFDGTVISQGRGTPFPFTVLGHPDLGHKYSFSFTPVPMPGMSANPRYRDTVCRGLDLGGYDTGIFLKTGTINLSWLLALYQDYPDKRSFFYCDKFDRLAGTFQLRKQIAAEVPESRIRQTWKRDIEHYKKVRNKYLIYR